jgi:hypothetical protein
VAKKQKGVNPALEKAIAQLLEQVMSDESVPLSEKVKVIDRSIKLEALKLKATDDDWGSGFFTEDDDDEK